MTIEEVKALNYEDAKVIIENAVYEATILIERLENAGKVSGNGHHARQAAAKAAADILKERWIKT